MKEVVLTTDVIWQLEEVYDSLQQDYFKVANELQFSCTGCPDNCCDSYFLHHTYIEWAYLWLGFQTLGSEQQAFLLKRAESWLVETEEAKTIGIRPQVMCPLNEEGLCMLYSHRLLVCRTHGVPARLMRPDGQLLQFPGCFRCQEIVARRGGVDQPFVDRTQMLRKLALLENNLLGGTRSLHPKVKMTIAEMLIKGPPRVTVLAR